MQAVKLNLADGKSFDGLIHGKAKGRPGEVVFNTGMVGYVESLTDPSYAGQILAFTYPLIGNYGVPSKAAWESSLIHVKGVVISEIAHHYSNQTAEQSLPQWLQAQGIPYILGVDT